MEIWKEVNGYEKYLKVSNYGQVLRLGKSVKHWKGGDSYITEIFAKTSLTKKHKGYKQVKLCVDYSKKSFLVHRLVAEAFIPNIDDKPVINHKNGVKTDNRVENLEWCTISENTIHATRTRLIKTKLTDIQALEIFNSNLSQRALAEVYNINHTIVWRIKNKKAYRHLWQKHY
jgi:hypothetical protein